MESRVSAVFLRRSELLIILPRKRPLARLRGVPIDTLYRRPFVLLRGNTGTRISRVFREDGLGPGMRFAA